MAVASYLLVAHEHAMADVRRAGFVYLAMTRLGTAFVVVAVLVLRAGAGAWDFASLRTAAAALDPGVRGVVFLLALVGCGTKAGVIPLRVWLPRAHPVAPSHVSTLMSGVMLKVGVYGLLRLTWDVLRGGPAWWDALILAALGQPMGAALGAGLFHALSHALFKALLFLGAGAMHVGHLRSHARAEARRRGGRVRLRRRRGGR